MNILLSGMEEPMLSFFSEHFPNDQEFRFSEDVDSFKQTIQTKAIPKYLDDTEIRLGSIAHIKIESNGTFVTGINDLDLNMMDLLNVIEEPDIVATCDIKYASYKGGDCNNYYISIRGRLENSYELDKMLDIIMNKNPKSFKQGDLLTDRVLVYSVYTL